MNVLHLTTFYPPYSFGGDAMYIYRLAHMQASTGDQVEVMHCVDSYHLVHPADPLVTFAEHPAVRRHEMRSGVGALSPLLTHQSGRPLFKQAQIQKVMDSRDWDVIHFHNTSLLGPAVLSLRPARGRPVKLYTTHEHWLVCPTHVLWKFGERPCEKPECIPCILRAKRPPQLWRYTGLLERCARDVDAFVSPSRFTARMHAERGFSRPVGVLPYFVPRADSDWQCPGPSPHVRPYFLFVGRLEKIKGLQAVIPLFGKMNDVDLLVAGSGEYEHELRTMAKSNPRVRFLGQKSQAELGALYRYAIATIVPSITYETFGMTIIESFARKTPVVVRDLGALPEVVEESSGGFIFRTDEELEQALRRLADNPGMRRDLGEKGYEKFGERWSPEAHRRLYQDLVFRCAANKG